MHVRIIRAEIHVDVVPRYRGLNAHVHAYNSGSLYARTYA